MGNPTLEIELVSNATNCINYRSQNFKRFRENSSRLESSKIRAGSSFLTHMIFRVLFYLVDVNDLPDLK